MPRPLTQIVASGSILLKMNKLSLSVLTISVLLSSCTSLKTEAQNVRYATKSEAPSGCKEIGEVSVGSIFPLFDMASVKNSMRNKTAEVGGNYLVIDEIKTVHDVNGGSSGYAGSGRAYQCP